jgi:hypothetical protein
VDKGEEEKRLIEQIQLFFLQPFSIFLSAAVNVDLSQRELRVLS